MTAVPLPPMASGDLLADRRFDYARALAREGEDAAAADLLRQVLERVPDYAPALVDLGEALQRLGDAAAARDAFVRALEADPLDRCGASVRLAALGGAPAMPRAYIEALYDGYAPRFEQHLTETLRYDVPARLVALLERSCARRGTPCRFGAALDLGCGTGLMARALGGRAAALAGIDLSAGMLRQAARTGLYARLNHADLVAALAEEPPASADLALAADVLMYVPDLAAVLRGVARVLRPGGLFLFSVETRTADEAPVSPALRLRHLPDAVRDLIAACGLRLEDEEAAALRLEKGQPVAGLLFAVSPGTAAAP